MGKRETLSSKEKVILDVFEKLLRENGSIPKHVVILPEDKIPEARLVVDKKEDKWVAYIKERGEISGYKEYEDIYPMCLDVFESLEKNVTDYCTDIFVPLVEDIIKNEYGGRVKAIKGRG